jgi:death-on-curing protein
VSVDYIRVEDVLMIHTDQINRYGGSHGVRDPGSLEAALFRPQTGYYPSLVDEAAALWESLSQNHPFVNGLRVTATDEETQIFLLDLYATGQLHYENLRQWLAGNTGPIG